MQSKIFIQGQKKKIGGIKETWRVKGEIFMDCVEKPIGSKILCALY
jgi:hypothetical protein